MLFAQTQFLKSCSAVSQIPADPAKKIAFWGRSNVGKSSLLNALIGKKKARISKTPGRTQLINLFTCPSPESLWCDLPGYGYAKIEAKQAHIIGKLLKSFFIGSNSPQILCWLLDTRHNLTKTDFLILPLIASLDCDLIIITTKNDKLSNQQALKQKKLLLDQLQTINLPATLIPTAVSNRASIEVLEQKILELLTKN
jgi:GTP-binding protein